MHQYMHPTSQSVWTSQPIHISNPRDTSSATKWVTPHLISNLRILVSFEAWEYKETFKKNINFLCYPLSHELIKNKNKNVNVVILHSIVFS